MAKGGKKRSRAGVVAWTGFDHAIRSMKRQHHDEHEHEHAPRTEKERRTAARTHDSQAKRDAQKLRLHIAKTEREISSLRRRLEQWDDVQETERLQKERMEAEKANQEEEPKQKRGRKGPETWKLRGAARPAHEVYDFDVRYVDPHVKAHHEAKKKIQRQRNILVIYKGRLGQQGNDGPPQPHSRNFLALLMQLGLLCLQARKFKAARAAFVECMELDGTEEPITTARTRLMRLYLEANHPDSARRLWERLPHDRSVWIRYSAALVEYVSWNILKEPGSTRATAETLLAQAIRANVFCAFYLAYHETFGHVMEYTDDIEDADEENSLLEAIEYCCSEQLGAWMGTEGALKWLRQVILRALRGRSSTSRGDLTTGVLQWKEKLALEEGRSNERKEGSSAASVTDMEDDIDIKMFAGMFRTSMEMLEDAGEFEKDIEYLDDANDAAGGAASSVQVSGREVS